MSDFGNYRLNNEHSFHGPEHEGQVKAESSVRDKSMVDISGKIIGIKANEDLKTSNNQQHEISYRSNDSNNNLSPEDREAKMKEEEEMQQLMLELGQIGGEISEIKENIEEKTESRQEIKEEKQEIQEEATAKFEDLKSTSKGYKAYAEISQELATEEKSSTLSTNSVPLPKNSLIFGNVKSQTSKAAETTSKLYFAI